MSRGAESIYELERERKRELYLQRIKENTAFYLEKYEQVYREYLSKGYAEVLEEEMSNLKEELQEVRQYLNSDPELARDISFNIKNYIYALKGFYNNAIKEQKEIIKIKKEKEKLQKEAIKNEKLNKINKAIKEIKNPIQREIAYKYIFDLKNKVLNDTNINIETEIEKIKQISEAKAKEYQENNIQEEIKTEIEKIKNTKEAPKELLQEIEKSLKNNELSKVKNIVEKSEQIVMDERIRKETVKSLYNTLKKDGFIVEKPKLIDGEVVIKAQKPSGNRAYCKVDIDGKFYYKFDNYQGQTCKKDIDKFKQDLDKIYGVKIKEEKITWQNPDMLYKDGIKAVSEDEQYL